MCNKFLFPLRDFGKKLPAPNHTPGGVFDLFGRLTKKVDKVYQIFLVGVAFKVPILTQSLVKQAEFDLVRPPPTPSPYLPFPNFGFF